jgi:hypothetical protein
VLNDLRNEIHTEKTPKQKIMVVDVTSNNDNNKSRYFVGARSSNPDERSNEELAVTISTKFVT